MTLIGPTVDAPCRSENAKKSATTRRVAGRFCETATGPLIKNTGGNAATVALYFMYYNFGRVHQTLRVTPAMEAGIADHVWSVEEIVGLLN